MIDDVEIKATTNLTTDAVGSSTHLVGKSTAPSSTYTKNLTSPQNDALPRPSSSQSTSLDRRKRAPPTFHFLAGLVTGSLSAILLQPADLLKTRVQQARGTSVGGALREILSQPRAVRQLWRGALPSVIRTGFGSALYFWSLNALRAAWTRRQTRGVATDAAREGIGQRTGGDMKQELGRIASLAKTTNNQTIGSIPGPALDSTIAVHTPPSSVHTLTAGSRPHGSSSSSATSSNSVNLVAGALARGGAGFVMMPVTVLKVRYESSMYNSYGSAVGLVGATRAIVAREGIRGLYAGYGATLIRDAPHAGLYVLFYEQAKRTFNRFGQSSSSSSTPTAMQANTVNFASGVLAAAAATAVTNPFDAIKTRIQLMPDRYRNMPQAAAIMLREDGPRAMLDGLGIRMARKAMSSALAWTIYEDLVRRAEARYQAAAS